VLVSIQTLNFSEYKTLPDCNKCTNVVQDDPGRKDVNIWRPKYIGTLLQSFCIKIVLFSSLP
jgi:hypothetical protein